jgi:hypothetical protein
VIKAAQKRKSFIQLLLDEKLGSASPDSLVGSDAQLYKYWASIVGSDHIQFLLRRFEFKDEHEYDLPNPLQDRDNQEDFWDDYRYSHNNAEKEKAARWEDLLQRVEHLKKYGSVDRDHVISVGKCVSTRTGEYNDETCNSLLVKCSANLNIDPSIEIYELYVMIVSWD